MGTSGSDRRVFEDTDVFGDNILDIRVRPKVISVNMAAGRTAEDRRYHHGDLRAELVRIAREFVRQHGSEGWSMREASRQVGVSQAAPYRHFADKAALLDAVGLEAYVELDERYRSAVDANPNPRDRAKAVARAYLQFAFEEPRLFRLIFSTPRLHGTREAKNSYRSFERAVEDSQARGALPVGSATTLAHVLWSAVHGVADLVLSNSFGRRHGKDVAEVMLDALFRGLRPD
jgi:AcrR family transcriptional regulator